MTDWDQAGMNAHTIVGHPDDLRRALYQRIADDLAIARAINEGAYPHLWRCCWISYPYEFGGAAAYQLCGAECWHWHHHVEAPIA